MSKIGLVVEGGGMKCAYSAGILDAFLDHGITVDYCIGVSAGSANAASYVAGQRGRNIRFYTEHIKDPMYFGVKSLLKTGNLFNLGYIYGHLTNSDGPDPLDYEAFMANPTEYELVATNAETGKPAYFNKTEFIKDDYRHVMASSAIPAVSKAVLLDDGHHYYDGGISDSLPAQRALDKGCDKLIFLLSKPRDYVKNPEKFKALYSLLCRKYPRAIEDMNQRHIMYTAEQKQVYELEAEGKAFIFAPDSGFQMGTYAMDAEANQKLYDMALLHFEQQQDALAKFLA